MTPLPSPFLEGLLRFLMPYFAGVTPYPQAARAEALETLAAYGARTRSNCRSKSGTNACGTVP